MSDYPTIGKCIYCGTLPTEEDPLSDEHIIPYGLSGKQQLRKASCKICAGITSAIEGKVLRNDLGGLRNAVNFPTRRKRKGLTELPIEILIDENTWEVINVPLDDYTPTIVLPDFKPPAYLDHRSYEEGIELVGYFSNAAKRPFKEIARKYNAKELAIRSLHWPEEWARMIAKIGYAYAIRVFGLDRIEQTYIVDSILGKTNDIGMWVGNDGQKLIKKDQSGHAIAHQIVDNDIQVRIKLFAWINAVEYVAIVGRLNVS